MYPCGHTGVWSSQQFTVKIALLDVTIGGVTTGVADIAAGTYPGSSASAPADSEHTSSLPADAELRGSALATSERPGPLARVLKGRTGRY